MTTGDDGRSALTVRISPALHTKLRLAAWDDGRAMAKLVEQAIAEYLERREQ